jgi:hypothetical protein
MVAFPLSLLNSVSRDDLVHKLFCLTFNKNKAVRKSVYKFIGSVSEYWRSTLLHHNVMALLFLSLGDSDAQWYLFHFYHQFKNYC